MTPYVFEARAADYFNPAMLERLSEADATPDLAQFESGGQAEGRYRVDVYVNGDFAEATEIAFSQQLIEGQSVLQPCLSVTQLASLGVRSDVLDKATVSPAGCVVFSSLPEATARLDFSAQVLHLSFPQIAMTRTARGYVSSEKWDDGLTAAILDYSLTSGHSVARRAGAAEESSRYASLRPGLNVGAWRLRNYSTYVDSAGSTDKWESAYTYAQRGIPSLKGQLVLGDTLSPGDVFDSVAIRGALLASDEEMLPESLRGYAPAVRGIARGDNAEVTIRQGGYVIYQAFVPAGPFEITDLYPTGGNGDLNVTVREADGSEQSQIVPFASLPVLQRAGNLRYAFSAGAYRDYQGHVSHDNFMQGSLIYGLPAGVTAYGGVQIAKGYQALSLGGGKNLGDYGAMSADITHADARLTNDQRRTGQSARVRYSKNIAGSGTQIAVAGYRYSTFDFLTLGDAFDGRNSRDMLTDARRRQRAELTLTQSLGEAGGYLSATAVRQNYWGNNRQTESWSAGYTNSIKGVGFSVNYAYNRDIAGARHAQSDRLVSMSLSVPLSRFFGQTYAGYNFSSGQKGGTSQNASLSGSALQDNRLNWSVSQGYGSRGQGATGSTRASYKGTYGEVNAAYSYTAASHNLNYGAQGTLLLHENGLTAGQSGGETFALVKMPGAAGVPINNQPGVKTDYRGYALVPFTSPYRNNEIAVSTENLPKDVDVAVTSQNVVPTRGAVVRATYRARVGQRALISLRRADGRPVPFGATVSYGEAGQEGAIVGDQGEVYLSGLASSGKLTARWGHGADKQCIADYTLPGEKTALMSLAARCR
ncbi:fimbria/pilus outer membrane usher protein [Pantoea sp. M_9]|uniref:fimbria/pilus outer membrane usher protein n=1 Tax=Pantoea sp. M_9 TaxID=2608041 RepID=UPI001CC1F219|nr:fimbria/pilus outer membrane usher protein [Pantoea sp. M_9]